MQQSTIFILPLHFPSCSAKTHRVEPVVDDVLEVLAHPDLLHQLVLVPVHAGQLPHVREDVLQAVGQLVRIHVVQPVLHVRVTDQLREAEDLPEVRISVTINR